MSNIQQAIELAANRFALEVVKILRGATLAELHAIAGKAPSAPAPSARNGRRPTAAPASRTAPAARAAASRQRPGRKRSPEEVTRLADRVLEFLKGAKQEMGVSAIAAGLKVPTADLGLPLTRLRDGGKVKTHGKKRSTVYRVN